MNTTAPPPRRHRRLRIAVAVVVGLVAAYGVIGGLVAPHFAKKIIADKLGEKLGRAVALDDLSVNPYTLSITAKGFRVLEADRKTAFATFDQVDVDGSFSSVYRLAPVANEVTVAGLKVNLVRDGETHYNITDILGRLAATPPDKDPARFSLSNIRLVNARVDFDDRPKATKHQVTDIDVAIPFVSNLPTHLKDYVKPKFVAKVNGTEFRLAGETLPFENSLRTHVALDLDSLELPRYIAYAPSELPVKVDKGKVDAHISVRFTQAAGKNPSVEIVGKVALRELQVSAPDEGALGGFARLDAEIESYDPFAGTLVVKSLKLADASGLKDGVRIPVVEANDIRVDLLKKTVNVASVATQDGVVSLKRGRDGAIELPLRNAHAQSPAAASPDAPPSNSPSWSGALGKLTLAGYRVTIADASVKPVATHRVTITQLDASDISTAKGAKASLNARLALDKGGSVDLASTVALDPLVLEAKIDARRIDLVPLRPYAEHFKTVQLKSGNASAKGTLSVSGGGNAIRIAYTGTAEIAHFTTFETGSNEDLLNWDSVRATGIGFKYGPDDPIDIKVADIAVAKAYSRVVVTPEGKINLQQLKFATAEDPQANQSHEPVKPRNVRIDRVSFADSRLNFTDHFIRPNYTADVGELGGSVTNLSSDPATRAVVDLKGSYDQTSPVTIAGTVNPLSGELFLDIAAKGKDIELPKLSAYSARYAGYGITKGKLTLDVKYHVENGKLEGRNNIFLDQLTFGDKVEGPEATTLPVIFAVNLLKDSKGAINLELPISGSLEDPQFEVSALISQVVVNLLKKALTNPFSLLSAAMGGGGGGGASGATNTAASAADDLAYVDFAPGREEIGAAGQKKLDSLTKALLDRPAIKLEMASRFDADKDVVAMKRAALDARVKAAKKGGELAEGEYPVYLKTVYEAEKLPKPEAKDGKPKDLTVAQMEAALLERMTVSDADLQALASRRGARVREYLVAHQLPADRVVAADVTGAKPEKAQLARVDFTLR